VSGKKKKELAKVLLSQTLSHYGTIYGSGRKMKRGRKGKGRKK